MLPYEHPKMKPQTAQQADLFAAREPYYRGAGEGGAPSGGDGIMGRSTPSASLPTQSVPRITPSGPKGAPQREVAGYGAVSRDAVAKYDPSMRTTRPRDTIQGQLTGIMDTAHPIMQRARTRARQEAQDRGLLNSTLAVQAAEGAVLDRAIPIAQYDAGVHEREATDNQVATNRSREYFAAERNLAGRDNQAAFNRALEYNAEAANLAAQGNMDAATKVIMADLEAQTRMRVARLDAATKRSVTQMEHKHQRILQTQLAAKDTFNQVANNIAHIEVNVKDAKVRQSMKNDQLYLMEQYLNMVEDSTALEGTELSHMWKERFQGTA